MAVPARYVGCVKTVQCSGFDNNVLQNFVNRMPYVQISIRIRRAIVQNKLGAPGALLTDFFVQTHFLPLFQALRLPLGQTRLHWKMCLGQVQCVFIIAHNVSIEFESW